MPTATSATEWNQLAANLCDTLSEADDDRSRQLFTSIADKWSLWIMKVLVEEGAPLRFTRIQERVEGISQKSLTKSLRQLERDGLITRKMFLEVPPRVEYAITQLGLDLIEQVLPLWMWVVNNLTRFNEARDAFDQRKVQPKTMAGAL